MDCHGAGEGWDVQLPDPRAARPCLRVRRPGGVDGVHGLPRGGLRCGALRRHARDGRRRATACSTTRSRAWTWQNLWFNGTLVGETGINAALCGTWGCPVLLVTGDEAACGEARELLGDGADDGRGQAGPRPLQRAHVRAAARARADRGRREAGALRSEGGRPYDPGSPCEIKVEYKRTPTPQTVLRASRASSSSTRARSSPAPTTGGRPGSSSSASH